MELQNLERENFRDMQFQRESGDLLGAVRDAHMNGYEHGSPVSVALEELAWGRKRSDWIWYVFPQIHLGNSPLSERFSVKTCSEIDALLEDPFVGSNISLAFVQAAKLVTSGSSIDSIFGNDGKKARSSAVLFSGNLDAHNKSKNMQLYEAASVLRDSAIQEVGMCVATLKFLQGC